MEKQMKDYSNAEIVEQLIAAAKEPLEYKGTPLNQFLRALADTPEPWCCKQVKRVQYPVISFSDGTTMRVHYCPRCGRAL